MDSSTGALQGLELALQYLPSEQAKLFNLIAVLGEGDWSNTILAAVALRSTFEVKQDVAALVARGFVDTANAGRYRVSTLVRAVARQHFLCRDPYSQRAARALLGSYCLNMAQTYARQARHDVQTSTHAALDGMNEASFQAFRNLVMPDLEHIRQSLVWAEQDQQWDLFLRFSFVACLELLVRPGRNSLKQDIALDMATLYQPTLTHGDLNARLSASHIIDGVFDTLFLPDARWQGVRAPGLLLQNVTMVGGQFMACDLSNSIWARCDAQRATFIACNLADAFFKDVKLYKAQLPEVRLAGAVLAEVNLRGADLRAANMRGAVLYHVDLREADLRDADLTGVAAQHVDLRGCKLEGVRWAGASIEELIVDDETIQRMIEARIADPGEYGQATAQNRIEAHERLQHLLQLDTIRFDAQDDLAEADLRAADLAGARFGTADLQKADLRAAMLSEATLTAANLRGAQLQAAQLAGANARQANLTAANLRATDLHHATLSNAVLQHTNATYARFQGAQLDGADLLMADLSHADLSHVNGAGANLRGAICTGTNLRGAHITPEQLFQMARLDGATLPDGKAVARLDGYYRESDALDEHFLRLAFCDGMFSYIGFENTQMAGSHLAGSFSHCNWANADLTNAHLSGNFSHCDFTEALLVRACLSGSFYEITFPKARFAEADLNGAMLINADLTGTDLNETQLRQAGALRGTLLPDGTMYDGRYNLPVDSETARNLGYDPENATEMAAFCRDREPKYRVKTV